MMWNVWFAYQQLHIIAALQNPSILFNSCFSVKQATWFLAKQLILLFLVSSQTDHTDQIN